VWQKNCGLYWQHLLMLALYSFHVNTDISMGLSHRYL
jgi:hypothetical protein